MEEQMIVTSVKMPKTMYDRAIRLAEKDDRPFSSFVRIAVQQYLDEREPVEAESKPKAKAGK